MLMTLDTELIPVELRELDQWVCWQDRDGRKVPINARTSQPAKSNDHTTWCDFQTACDALAVNGNLSGLGFCFADGDGLVGVDFDECLDDRGNIAEWALTWLASFDSYAEISPSGRGRKVWVYGNIERGRKTIIEEREGKSPGIEVYSSGRFFTLTSQRWEGLADSSIKPCQPQIDRLYKKFFSEPEPPKPQPNTGTSPAPSSGQLSIQERAARYLAKMPPAVSGQHGHDRTYHAACVLMLGFAMAIDDAWPVFCDWNATCEPPWSERDLRRKLDEANKLGGQRGHLLTGQTYRGPDPNLTALFQSVEQANSPKAEIHPTPENFPKDALRPPGFIGDVIDHNLRTALYPLPQIALPAHLALMATLTSHKIADALWGTRTNAYFCGLAPTRGGKEHGRQLNKSIMLYAGLDRLLGPESWASGSGLTKSLESNPVRLFQVDEISHLLSTMQDAKRSPHLFKINSELLKLWSGSSTIVKGDAYADEKRNITLNFPHAIVYGTGVPSSFWEAITSENVTGGLLGRFLIFEMPTVDNGYVDMQKPERFPNGPPERILRVARAWGDLKPHRGNLAEIDGSSPLIIAHTAEAEERYWQHANETNGRTKKEKPETAAVWRGTPEKTSKLALLFAASRATAEQIEDGNLDETLEIELQDVNRAIAVSNWCTRRMLHQADLHVADNDFERLALKALRKLKADGTPMPWRDFMRTAVRNSSKIAHSVLDYLVQCGYVEIENRTANNGAEVVYIKRK